MSYCNKTDAELVQLFSEGDELAFTLLTKRYFGLIRSIASNYRVSGLDADDLAQEGLLGFLGAAKTFKSDGGASFKTYASICVDRRICYLLRRSDTLKSKAMNDYVSVDDERFVDIQGGADPQDLYIGKEFIDLLRREIKACLSAKEYDVFMLYLAGERYDAIALQLAMSRKSVDNAMQRIRKKLKKLEGLEKT